LKIGTMVTLGEMGGSERGPERGSWDASNDLCSIYIKHFSAWQFIKPHTKGMWYIHTYICKTSITNLKIHVLMKFYILAQQGYKSFTGVEGYQRARQMLCLLVRIFQVPGTLHSKEVSTWRSGTYCTAALSCPRSHQHYVGIVQSLHLRSWQVSLI
jgi:hypothetical protein